MGNIATVAYTNCALIAQSLLFSSFLAIIVELQVNNTNLVKDKL